MSQFNTPKSPGKLRARPYQKEAIGTVLDLVKDQIRDVIINPEGFFSQSALLEMATGSGKTFTVGKILEKIITLRDKYNSINTANEFEGLNIVFLTNRIDGLEQFRDDLLHGRNGADAKNPILGEKVLENIQSYTFHSQADNLDDFDGRVVKTEDEEESFGENTQKTKDHFYFSTFQTAFKKEIHSKLDYVDLIIIDEAHNVNKGNDFKQVLDELSQKTRNGKSPMILPVTATPSNLTKELFGEAMFEFGLAEYLASEYSPSVAYNLITASDASPSEIQALKLLIEDTKKITDVKEKKTLVKEIEERFDQIMSSYPKLENLVEDLLARLLVAGDGEIEETIIFANSKQEADDIAKAINTEMKENIALSYHSSNKNNNALGRLKRKNDPTKIVIAVDMLNESIDLPTVSHVVFWRSTDVAKIFLQQFGRGLRGDGIVQYWDYVGSMKNFSWIGNIYEQYKEFVGGNSREQNGGTKASKFQLLGGNKSSQDHQIDLSELGFDILGLKNEFVWKTQEYFRELSFETFKENLQNIKNFKTTNTTDTIQGMSFRQIYDGYLNYRLDLKNSKERFGYYGIIVQLLQKVKDGEIGSFEELNTQFQEEKAILDTQRKTTLNPKEYFENLSFEPFQEDLQNIKKFTIRNTTDTIHGMSFFQIYDGYLNYKLDLKNREERVGYHSLIVQLFKKVKDGEILSFEELNKEFQKEKASLDTQRNTTLNPKDYFENLSFETFQEDLQNIKKFTTKNTTDTIHGMSFKQIYDGYLNYRLDLKNSKERKGYCGLIVQLLQKVKDGEIGSFEELNTQFQKEKASLDTQRNTTLDPKDYFENLSFETFQEDLKSIKKFTTNNTTDTIHGMSFHQIYDGYLNYRLDLKRVGYKGTIIQLLQKVKDGEIGSFEEMNTQFQKEKAILDAQRKTTLNPKDYFENLSFETFQEDLQNIKKFTTKNTTDTIHGMNFKQIYGGYLNYRLDLKNFKERSGYYGVIIQLLQKVKDGEIGSFEELNIEFKKGKTTLDTQRKTTLNPNEYFETLSFEKLREDLQNIKKFTTTNTIDTIHGMSFHQIYDGYLNYRFSLKKRKERSGYYGVIIQLLQKVKDGEIGSFEELNTQFKKGKTTLDTQRKTTLNPNEYFETLSFEKLREDLQNIKKFTTTNTTGTIHGMSFKQIYDGYLNYRVSLKKQKERFGYYGLIVQLLQKVKDGEIGSFEELNTQFEKGKQLKDSAKKT